MSRALDSRHGVNLVRHIGISLEQNEPLYKRVPTRDEDGKRVSDFMMLIPGLRDRPAHELKDALAGMQAVLTQHTEVVYADLNMKINVLWVSIKPRRGLIDQLATELQNRVPGAKLVGDYRPPQR